MGIEDLAMAMASTEPIELIKFWIASLRRALAKPGNADEVRRLCESAHDLGSQMSQHVAALKFELSYLHTAARGSIRAGMTDYAVTVYTVLPWLKMEESTVEERDLASDRLVEFYRGIWDARRPELEKRMSDLVATMYRYNRFRSASRLLEEFDFTVARGDAASITYKVAQLARRRWVKGPGKKDERTLLTEEMKTYAYQGFTLMLRKIDKPLNDEEFVRTTLKRVAALRPEWRAVVRAYCVLAELSVEEA